MSLSEKMKELVKRHSIKSNEKIHFLGVLKQHGFNPAILNADNMGQQKRGFNPLDNEVEKISPECFTASLFQNRNYIEPMGSISEENLEKFLQELLDNSTSLRGGAHMSKNSFNGNSTKSLSFSSLYNRNLERIQEINYRLGIQSGESGKNDAGKEKNDPPRMQILYKNLEFVFHGVLDLSLYGPEKCGILTALIDKIGGEKKLKIDEKKIIEALDKYLNAAYPLNDKGEVDIEVVVDSIKQRINNYQHQVHRRYNAFLGAENVQVIKTNSLAEDLQVLKRIKDMY